ncbi:amino acid ABC transporter permease [Martelella lutilitoris]|uniref:Amino acid ABC transporter permease n=1 Tax=Martelella lutilitoris TaxID=2583532 RepID=A0A5C4JP73_9HYPH|nr:amino acid ABC transporter permease [Martelella lutilitoris]
MAHEIAYVRKEMQAQEPAPQKSGSIALWLRTNLFANPKDAFLSILAIIFLVWAVPPVVEWLFINAAWTGTDRTACATIAQGGVQPDGWSGACWAFIGAKFDQIMFGRYPDAEMWRPILVAIVFTALLIPMLMPKAPHKGWNAFALFIALPFFSFFILYGGVFGLPVVDTSDWGGLMVTLILSYFAIAVSLPLGIILALGRRSKMPVMRTLSIMFIEVVRGVPLITILFMASVMLPLFLPEGMTINKFLRAIVGVSLFISAYMAETIRGGLQAMPKGQFEGAASLGLGYWQTMRLVILPQAIKLVIPAIVNQFISIFKDTSLVSIIGMFDLLGIIKFNFTDSSWASPVTPITGLIFAGFVFFIFCFAMSRYSSFMERHLDTGHRS